MRSGRASMASWLIRSSTRSGRLAIGSRSIGSRAMCSVTIEPRRRPSNSAATMADAGDRRRGTAPMAVSHSRRIHAERGTSRVSSRPSPAQYTAAYRAAGWMMPIATSRPVAKLLSVRLTPAPFMPPDRSKLQANYDRPLCVEARAAWRAPRDRGGKELPRGLCKAQGTPRGHGSVLEPAATIMGLRSLDRRNR